MKNHGVDAEVDGMFEMGNETMALPLEEKMKFEQGDGGMSFGCVAAAPSSVAPTLTPRNRYKAAGANAVDETGLKDTVEFINVSKDDALAWPTPVHRTYPETVNARMASTIQPFIAKSLAVNNTILEVFNEKLGLPAGELLQRHSRNDWSASEARVIKNPPAPKMSPERQALGAHTDFGSLVRTLSSHSHGTVDI